MEKLTLEVLLKSQDLGEKGIQKVCNVVLNNNTKELDPISRYLAEQFEYNNYCSDQDSIQSMKIDLDYAIHQLQKAKSVLLTYQ